LNSRFELTTAKTRRTQIHTVTNFVYIEEQVAMAIEAKET